MNNETMNQQPYTLAELNRKFEALLIFGVVFDVDYANKKLRLKEGNLETGWLPFPAESGRNYRRWRPIKKGQQLTAICRSGDPTQGRVLGESWWDDNDSPSTDENIDLIEFTGGATIRYDSTTNVLEFAGFADVIIRNY